MGNSKDEGLLRDPKEAAKETVRKAMDSYSKERFKIYRYEVIREFERVGDI
ncbi:MAG: hypothetical protein ACE5RH_01695 [Nitrosarchaeum sp.]